jgi:predicted transposase YbfD/YdcC
VFKDILWLENLSKWAGLQSIFAIKNEVLKGETRTEEVLFYISSLKKTPLEFLKIVRSHWQIESLHWCLDVVFNEDECLLQNTNAQLNLNLWRKFSLCIHKEFKNVKKHKKSYKNMMFNCLLSDKQLLSLLHELNNR